MRTQRISRPREAVFAYFADASNLEAITPPFLRFRVLTPTPVEMRTGVQIDYALSLFGIPFRWRSRITAGSPAHAIRRSLDSAVASPLLESKNPAEFGPETGGG